MRVEIEPGVHLLGSKDGADWPLIVVDTVWPGFGYARDVAAFSARLAVFRSCLGLKSSAAPVDEMLHGGGRSPWSAARIGGCAANASR